MVQIFAVKNVHYLNIVHGIKFLKSKDKSFIINLPIVNDLSSLQKIELKSGIETSYRSLNK